MAWSCWLIFLHRAAVCHDWLGEGSGRSGPSGHLCGSASLNPQQLKQTSFGGAHVWEFGCVCVCNPCQYLLYTATESKTKSDLLLFFPLLIFLCSLQMQSNLNFVFCLSNPPQPALLPRSADKKTRVYNEPTKGWRYFNCKPFFPSARALLYFSNSVGLVFISVCDHLLSCFLNSLHVNSIFLLSTDSNHSSWLCLDLH